MFIEPCDTLRDSVEYGIAKGKKRGIFCWEYFSDRKATRKFFGVKSGELTEKGIAFNFCPFCGEQIDAPFVVPDVQIERQAASGLSRSNAGLRVTSNGEKNVT
jgi:hypothetical protein